MSEFPSFPTIEANGRSIPPDWAVQQRFLIDQMNRSAVPFVERYTRPEDGTFVWRKEWPGMDGSDDGYESYLSFPLLHLLGGGDHLDDMGRRLWDAVTWQFTQYGQVHREFDAYYDWMHHGECYTYLYYMAMSNPYVHRDRQRILNFAAMYTGEDPDAPNWDSEHKMIRSPINGSKGPCFEMSAEDWSTHRPILANYLAPYEDLEGHDASDPMFKADWDDDETFGKILKQMNGRMVPGDVPLNLNATTLITAAYMLTGEDKYKQWVLDYLQVWADRTKQNDGIIPDNVGPNGKIGELMGGKWWGGYYGWRWPHGVRIVLEGILNASCNAMLLTGDDSVFDLLRSQVDLIWSLRKEEDGAIKVPGKHGDCGWFLYGDPDPHHYIYMYDLTQSDQDLERIRERFQGRSDWRGNPWFGKGAGYGPSGWHAYAEKLNPDFPAHALEDTYLAMISRLQKIDDDDDNIEEWDVHHWQQRNPVAPEPIIQMAMGSPSSVYHGGHLHSRLRYFDPCRKRAGLPEHVGALVESVSPADLTLTLANTDLLEARDILVQAGGFAEHEFTEVKQLNSDDSSPTSIHGQHFVVRLGPAAQAKFKLGMKRYAHQPTFNFPWREA